MPNLYSTRKQHTPSTYKLKHRTPKRAIGLRSQKTIGYIIDGQLSPHKRGRSAPHAVRPKRGRLDRTASTCVPVAYTHRKQKVRPSCYVISLLSKHDATKALCGCITLELTSLKWVFCSRSVRKRAENSDTSTCMQFWCVNRLYRLRIRYQEHSSENSCNLYGRPYLLRVLNAPKH